MAHLLTEYLLHVNQVGGVPACALIWLDPARLIPRESVVTACTSRHGREDLLISAPGFAVRLAGVAVDCLEVVQARGLHVIEHLPGKPPQAFLLPLEGAA